MSLGSIIVRLSMATADFETDAGRAAKVAEKRAKEIDAAFRKAGVAIGLALGAAMVGATAAIKKTIDKMDDLSKSSQRVGLPTEEFSRLAYAGGLADVEVSTLVSTLGKLTKAQAAALDGTTDQAKVFTALGISVTDATGKMRSSTDVLMDFADRFKAMQGSPEAMAAGFALFGRSFQDMIPLIKEGSDAIRQAGVESDQLGNTLSTEAGKAAEEFNDNLTRMQTALGGVWQEIAIGMLPQLNAMTGDMVAAAKQTDALRSAGAGLIGVVSAIGTAFGVVSRMARQFGVDMAAAAEMAAGFKNIAAGIATFGFTDMGAKGKAQVQSAITLRKQMLDGFKRQDANAAAETRIAALQAGGKGDGGGLPAGWFGKNDPAAEAAAMQKRLQAAFGPTASAGKKTGSSKKTELTDEQKALQKLNEEYAREIESRNERLGMMGLETEASRVLWETENGRWKDLDANQKAELIAAAGLEDVRRKTLDDIEKESRAREDAKEGYDRAIAMIREEGETLGMTNDQLEIYNRLKSAGVGLTDEMKRSIQAETKLLQQQRDATDDQVEMMDGLRSTARGFLGDLREGVGVWDSLTNAANSFADVLWDMASRKLIENLFGQDGDKGGGGFGDAIGGLLGSLFGGGKASGGWAMPNTVYEVNERGMEMASVGGRDYMLTGSKPVQVTPNNRLRNGGGSTTININVPKNTSYATANQAGQSAYAGAALAAKRNG